MLIQRWLSALVGLVHTIKDENLTWQVANQSKQTRLAHQRILAENELADVLKKRSVQLEHELNMLKTQHEAELAMFKAKCAQDLKDYKQYLTALDQLKKLSQQSYAHLPDAVAFTIHHHAKCLLNTMWESKNPEQKIKYELQLITFMTTLHEEARLRLEGKSTTYLPENTLNLIQQ